MLGVGCSGGAQLPSEDGEGVPPVRKRCLNFDQEEADIDMDEGDAEREGECSWDMQEATADASSQWDSGEIEMPTGSFEQDDEHPTETTAAGQHTEGGASTASTPTGEPAGTTTAGAATSHTRAVVNGRAQFGACQVCISHGLRYTSQYVYCCRCGGYAASSHAKKLYVRCQPPDDMSKRANKDIKSIIRRLNDGKAPRRDLVAPETREQGRYVLTAEGLRCMSGW